MGTTDMIKRGKRRLPCELERLPCIQAEILYRVGDGRVSPSLEGPGFDRDGNFYVCYTSPDDTSIRRITPLGEMSEFYHVDKGMTIGFAQHPDGRLFFSDMLSGSIRVFDLEGTLLEELFPRWRGEKLRIDCMEFDGQGDLWFSDLRGTAWEPTGGIYKLTAGSGYRDIELLLGCLAAPNGLHHAPCGDVVWAVESSRNSLMRIQLDKGGAIMKNQFSPMTVYRSHGRPNLDSIQVDQAGNVYVGVMFGGRAVIFDPDGLPLANILVPGYAEGKLSYTPNLSLRTDRAEGYLVASDRENAFILRFEALAPKG